MDGAGGACVTDVLAGAATTSRHLPPAQAAELLHPAKDAFTSGLNTTGFIATGIFGALAALIGTMRRTSETQAELPETECAGAQS